MANATYSDLLGSAIVLHYDASDAASIFEDTSSLDPAEDGDIVLRWAGQSDASIQTAMQATGGNGPTYRADYASSGYAALEFDGVNDRLELVSAGLAAEEFFVLCAHTRISGTASTVWFRGSLTRLARLVYTGSASNQHQIQIGIGGSYATNSFNSGLTVSKLVSATHVSDTRLACDAGRVGCFNQADSFDNLMPDQLFLGAGDNSGVYQPGNIALHEILYISSAAEWGQVVRAATLMRDKWGVADSNPVPQAPAAGGGYYNPFRNPVFGG